MRYIRHPNDHRASSRRTSSCLAIPRWAVLALLGLAASLAAPQPAAAQAGRDAAQRYQDERAACNVAPAYVDRRACLREAGAALQAARRGQLGNGADYERNALVRCTPLAPEERADCEARVRGQGTTRGSVAEGGIYRETVTRMVLTPEGWRPLKAGEQP